MSCNLEFLGVLRPTTLPILAEDFPLNTVEDLRRAYREHAKHNDARLIFSTTQLELSALGRGALFSCFPVQAAPNTGSEEHWDDMLKEGSIQARLDATTVESTYWNTLEQRISAFLVTQNGQHVAYQLHVALGDYLTSTFFRDLDSPLPKGLYERIVTSELCWRAYAKRMHQRHSPELYETEPPVELQIMAAFDGDRRPEQTEALFIPVSFAFNQFQEFIAHQSCFGDCKSTDIWFYENPLSEDVHSPKHWKAITSVNYENLKALLIGAPRQEGARIRLLLWHEKQVKQVQATCDAFFSENVLICQWTKT